MVNIFFKKSSLLNLNFFFYDDKNEEKQKK